MDCQTIETPSLRAYSRLELAIRNALGRVFRKVSPAYPDLDLEVMSDYMKRDLGFMDGRDLRRDSDLTG